MYVTFIDPSLIHFIQQLHVQMMIQHVTADNNWYIFPSILLMIRHRFNSIQQFHQCHQVGLYSSNIERTPNVDNSYYYFLDTLNDSAGDNYDYDTSIVMLL